MKKALGRILWLLMICQVLIYVLTTSLIKYKHDYKIISCVTSLPAIEAAKVAEFSTTEECKLETEDMIMHIVYRLARRNVVKITVKDAAGSGIIWRLNDDIVIASNRHLLMNDVNAIVTFCNNETANAQIIGYSQQYDIGFIRVPESEIGIRSLRDIYEAVPVLYETETKNAKSEFDIKYKDNSIIQVGFDIENAKFNCSTGTIKGLKFNSLFNTNILETQCYSKAGMSGGGVFDADGRFLGMISGGDVPEGSKKKEAEVTYSIPAKIIEEEYKNVIK